MLKCRTSTKPKLQITTRSKNKTTQSTLRVAPEALFNFEHNLVAPYARFPAHFPRATGPSDFIGEGFIWRKPKITQITTAPGRERGQAVPRSAVLQLGAGKTETEPDEPVSSRVTLFHSLSQAVLNALYPLSPSQIIIQPPV